MNCKGEKLIPFSIVLKELTHLDDEKDICN